MRHIERYVLYYLPPLLCMGLIFYLSSRTWVPIPLPAWVIVRDKVAHAIMYGGLCYLWVRALHTGHDQPLRAAGFAFAVLIAALYGWSDEYHQSFVPGRSSSVGDAVADSVGALILACILYIHQRTREGLTDF